MNNQVYYFITGISNRSNSDNPKFSTASDKRCWGFFDNFIEADEAVKMNDGDIWELEYDYMVIEGHYMGTIAMSTCEQHWYHYDEGSERFVPIEIPKWAVNLVDWGIG